MQEFLNKKFKKIFSEAIPILEILENNGYLAYFVGGCVRDFLMNNIFSDIDIATSAHPEQIKKIFSKTFDTGIKHGTVTVIFNKVAYELTTFRNESNYVNHRAPENVEFITTIEEDLQRRDFTINAMALDKKGALLDFHGGKFDLSKQIIRTVNNPNERFSEDALRMLRAFRFVSKLDFEIEEKTYSAIIKNKKLIEFISVERIVSEFKELFKGKANEYALKLMLASGLNNFIPFFKKVVFYTNFSSFNFEQSMFYLLDKNNINFNELKKLKLSNKEYLEIKNYKCIKEMLLEKISLKKIIYKFSKEKVFFVVDSLDFQYDINILDINLPIKSFNDINIDNKEIMNLFPEKKPGPWIKEINELLEDAIIHNLLENNNKKIKEFIKKEVRL